MIVRVHLKPERTKRPMPWLISLGVHGALIVWMVWPTGSMQRTPTAYEQLVKGREDKIVIYRFREKLPDVKPLQHADARPPRARVAAKQSIVASPKNAPKEKQMVVMAAPEIKQPPTTFQSPNLLALQMSPPAPPERKKFSPQAAQPKVVQDLAKPKAMDAPQAEAVNPAPDRLLDQLGAAPKLSQDNRPKFVAPAAHVNAIVAKVLEMDASPPPPSGELPTNGPSLSQLNIAVVGLNPGPKDAPLPTASHAAQFSAGPKLNPNGGAGEGNPNASLTVPDLMVKGGAAEARAALMAANRVDPTSAEALRGMSKYARPEAIVREPGESGAAHVSSAPNPRFDGREVYSMAIQMPNITSYSGSWLMWYAGRGLGKAGPVAPPSPRRKVDPKYIATAMADRVEGRVQLLCVISRSGHVDQVELVRGIDARLDRSAMEALSKWEFTPATRSGQPVEVDVMVEIPFHLAPREPK